MCLSVVKTGLLHFCQETCKEMERVKMVVGYMEILSGANSYRRRALCHVRGRRKRDQEGLVKETVWKQVQE